MMRKCSLIWYALPPHYLPNSNQHPLLASGKLLSILLRLNIEVLPITLKLLRNRRLQRIIRDRLTEQLLRSREDAHDLTARLPRICLQDSNAHRALVVKCYVGVVDSRLEVYDGWLEGVFGGEDEKELELAALGEPDVSRQRGRKEDRREGIRRKASRGDHLERRSSCVRLTRPRG